MKFLDLKPRVNKRNKQINISIPRKQLSKEMLEKIIRNRRVRVKLK